MRLLRAWTTLAALSFRRLLWSANTLMILFPLTVCGLVILRRDYGAFGDVASGFDAFSHEAMGFMIIPFVVPICALAYGTTSIGSDREEHTLLFLLMRPIPRGLLFLAKYIAALPLVLGMVVGSFYLYCLFAGEAGLRAFNLYLPAVFYMSLAYTSVFHLLAVVFRHGTIVALVYSLFVEGLLGNMPGIVKRLAVSFYGRSMVYDLGAYEGLPAPPPEWFVPVSAQQGAWILALISLVSLVVALVIFHCREYRDLT